MKANQLAVVAVVPLFAGFLLAQEPSTPTQSPAPQSTAAQTATATTWNGNLVDAGCQATHTDSKAKATDCPVAMTTTSFGVLTPDGKYFQFDPASNTRIAEMMTKDKKWNKEVSEHAPVSVRVVGKLNGDLIVVESIE